MIINCHDRIDVQSHLSRRYAAGDAPDRLWDWVFDRHWEMSQQDVGAANRFYTDAEYALHMLGLK